MTLRTTASDTGRPGLTALPTPSPAAGSSGAPAPAPQPPAGTEPDPGYFADVKLVRPHGEARIDFVRFKKAPALPPPMTKVIKDIQVLARLIFTQFQFDKAVCDELLQQVFASAWGLKGSNPDINLVMQNLDEVRDNVAAKFVVVREYYYWKYLAVLCWIGVPLLLAGALVYWAAELRIGVGPGQAGPLSWLPAIADVAHGYPAWVSIPITLLWIPAGATLGMFVDYVFRVDGEVSYENLTTINPGRWKVSERLLNTLVVAYCFAASMAIPIFQIGITSVLLNDFVSAKPYLAGLVGFVTAFSYAVVRDILYRIKPEVRTK